MRDPNRIPQIAALLEDVWKTHPDWRLGQLVVNATRGTDPFHVEDSDMIGLLTKIKGEEGTK